MLRLFTQNADMFWKPALAIQGDVADCLVRMRKGLKGGLNLDPEWLKSLQARDAEKEEANK